MVSSLSNVNWEELVDCQVHGLCPSVSTPAGPECMSCVQYVRLARKAKGKLTRANTSVTLAMLSREGTVCSICGEHMVMTPRKEDWGTGVTVEWELKDPAAGMRWSNVVPAHFRCWCVLGPKRPNTREDCMRIWQKAAAAAAASSSTATAAAASPLVLSKSDVHTLVRQYKALIKRHESRFTHASDLTAECLVNSWYASGGRCTVCRDPIDLSTPYSRRQLSWDRADNSLGYTSANTQPTCWGCNAAKCSLSIAQCLELFKKHTAFTSPACYVEDPGTHVDVAAELALIKRVLPYFKPREVNVRIHCPAHDEFSIHMKDVLRKALDKLAQPPPPMLKKRKPVEYVV